MLKKNGLGDDPNLKCTSYKKISIKKEHYGHSDFGLSLQA